MKADSTFVFARLWEGWKPPGSEEWIPTCAIITCEPDEIVHDIRGCQSSCGRRSAMRGYLGEAGKEILVPIPADKMKAWPISPRVNCPKNNDPGILEPIGLGARSSD